MPSLSLLAQTLREWLASAASSFTWPAVCSDPSIRTEGDLVEYTTELVFRVVSDPGLGRNIASLVGCTRSNARGIRGRWVRASTGGSRSGGPMNLVRCPLFESENYSFTRLSPSSTSIFSKSGTWSLNCAYWSLVQ